MVSTVLGVAAVTSTILRSWPQFVSVLRTHKAAGVSTLTWTLVLNNHSAWSAYGLLSENPVLIFANILATMGCAATVWVLGSRLRAVLVTIAAALGASAIYAFDDGLLLAILVGLSLSMFVPQMLKVFRTSPEGVSVSAWVIAALSSVIWISWASSIDHVALASAHFFIGPVATVIAVRTYMAHRPAGPRRQPLARS